MKRCLDFAAEKAASRPLTPVIELAGGTHTAVGGFYPKGGPTEKLKSNIALKEVLEAKLITSTLDIQEKATFEVKLKMADEKEAKKLHKSMQSKVGLAIIGLTLAPSRLLGPDLVKRAPHLAPTLVELLEQLKFTQKGDEVSATANLEDGSGAVRLLLTAPAAARK